MKTNEGSAVMGRSTPPLPMIMPLTKALATIFMLVLCLTRFGGGDYSVSLH